MPFKITLSKGDVQSALTDQGYTGARAANLDAAISSRAAAGAAMDLVSGAKAAIWNEAIPGSPTAGSFGERVKNNLDASISSRAAPGAAMDLIAPYNARLDAAISSRAAPGAAMDLISGAKAAIWNEAIPGTPTAGSFGERVKNNLDASISSRAAPGAAMDLIAPYNARLDAAISSRASGTDYTAARAAKLDNLDAAITSRAAPGAAMALASPYDARLDAAVSSRASPTDVDTQLGNRGITTGRMSKLDLVAAQSSNSGNVAAGANSSGLTVQLDTGGASGQARAVVEVRYTSGGAATFYAEGSDDGTTWYEGDTFSETGAVTNKLIGYLNTHRYFRFRSPTTGIDLSFEVRSLL